MRLTEDTYPRNMLGEGDKSGAQTFFELGIKYLTLTNKYPATGLATSVDIELQAARSVGYMMRYPISGLTCPNAFVVAKDATTKQVLGSARVNTSFGFFVNDCIGKAPMNLTWPAGNSGQAIFEVYEERGTIHTIDQAVPVFVSQPYNLNLSQKDAKDSGLIRQESENPLTARLFEVTGPIRQLGKVAGAGLVGYFMWTNREAINKSFKKLVGDEAK